MLSKTLLHGHVTSTHHLPCNQTQPIKSQYQISHFPLQPITAIQHESHMSLPSPPAQPFSVPPFTASHPRKFLLPTPLLPQKPPKTMASLAASMAAASLGVSEMLGNPLKFNSPAQPAPSASSPATVKTVALFSKKAPAKPKAKPATTVLDEELAKWYGPDRRIFLPEGLLDRSEVPEYLTGEVPGDYGYDPFGLSKKPDDFAKYQAYELIHGRWAMLGAAGFVIPEALNKFGANCGPEAVWFKTGALLLDGNTLNYFGKSIPINLIFAIIAEVVLVGGAEYYRIINGLDLEDKLHPGGPFDPLGLAKDPDQAALLKVKEIKNGRLAMFAMLGFFIQAYVTGQGPVENLTSHLSDPFGNNLLTVIAGTAERAPTL
ncbi:Chlorophyll A-B binding protein [Dillenia turbinata]|uniref:Chlorophyll a-b binding protein, chloroplastic n=1 Tax=Dillenia turbinata TaxID=194707 RepID=A0AAN8W5S5_9MAGN